MPAPSQISPGQLKAAILQPKDPGLHLCFSGADQAQVMGGDQNRLAHLVELNQQRQQALGHLPVHVAGWFVGKDHIG